MSTKLKSNSFRSASSHNSCTNSNNIAKEEISIALIGSVGVGKSALLVKYMTKRFIGEYDPVYEGCWTKSENVDGVDLTVQVYDTYDKEKKNLEKYIKWSDYLILCYSITNYQSFLEAQEYFDSIQELIRNNYEDFSQILPMKILLLGNKQDLERYRQVSKLEVDAFIEKYSNSNLTTSSISNEPIIFIQHMETTSCEEFEIIQNLFHKIIREVRHDREIINQLLGPLHISEDSTSSNTISSKFNKNRINNNLTSNTSASSKRSKSPRPNELSSPSLTNQNNFSNVNSSSINNITNSTDTNSPLHLNNGSPNNVQLNQNISMNNQNMIPLNGNLKDITKKNSSKFPFFNKFINNK